MLPTATAPPRFWAASNAALLNLHTLGNHRIFLNFSGYWIAGLHSIVEKSACFLGGKTFRITVVCKLIPQNNIAQQWFKLLQLSQMILYEE